MRTITAQAYDDLLLTRRPLLDLRAPVEFARGAVPGGVEATPAAPKPPAELCTPPLPPTGDAARDALLARGRSAFESYKSGRGLTPSTSTARGPGA